MKLTIQLQLLPTPSQATLLMDTMRIFNEAATFAAHRGFATGVFSQPSVHRLAYFEIRRRFQLSAQLAVRAIGKAVECFARDKTRCPIFRPEGSVTYDQRNMSFKGLDKVSLATIKGRETIDMVYGEYQSERFDRIKGQCDLVKRDGRFYLIATVDIQERPPVEVKDFVGVDLGIVHVATTDDGAEFSGKQVDIIRQRSARARKTYQRRNTRGSRRRLRKISGRQRRFQSHTNHVISKKIVAKALCEGKGLAIEELTGIRTRCEATVRKNQRSRLSNWSFSQLRMFLSYKSRLVGLPVIAVNPRDTSRMCSSCGHCDKRNRKNQGHFECLSCGFTINADQNGARNIRFRALAVSVKNRDLAAVSGEHPDPAASYYASPSGT